MNLKLKLSKKNILKLIGLKKNNTINPNSRLFNKEMEL